MKRCEMAVSSVDVLSLSCCICYLCRYMSYFSIMERTFISTNAMCYSNHCFDPPALTVWNNLSRLALRNCCNCHKMMRKSSFLLLMSQLTVFFATREYTPTQTTDHSYGNHASAVAHRATSGATLRTCGRSSKLVHFYVAFSSTKILRNGEYCSQNNNVVGPG
jgi:hypothetical protein